MNRIIAVVVAGLVTAGLLGWLLMSALGNFLRTPTGTETDAEAVPAVATPDTAPAPAGPRIKATLYFVAEDGQRLVGVESEVPLAEGTVAQARAIVDALLSSVPPEPLSSSVPAGTALRGIYVSSRNEVFVDLDGTVRAKHPGGSMQELLTVYGLVNTILVNLPTVTEVQILIDGREVDTLAGHVDLRRPLRKNEALIVTPFTSPGTPPS
jgi:spore germination protein GerM